MILLIAVALFLMISAVFAPALCVQAASNGIQLALKTVIPSLLPFFIASSILIKTGIVVRAGKILKPAMRTLFNCPGEAGYVFAMSILSGYPSGAKLTSYFLNNKSITVQDAKRMLSYCSTSGPAFMLGAVAVMLGSPSAGVTIAISHYAGALVCGFVYRFLFRRAPHDKEFPVIEQRSLPAGEILAGSVADAVKSLAMVSGFIMLFSVISSILASIGVLNFLGTLLSPLLRLFSLPSALNVPFSSGVLEISNGCNLAASSSAPLLQKVILIAGMISWGGFCVHAQAVSFFKEKGIAPSYLFGKILHCVVSMTICAMLAPLMISESVLSAFAPANPAQTLLASAAFAAMGLAVFGILVLLCKAFFGKTEKKKTYQDVAKPFGSLK